MPRIGIALGGGGGKGFAHIGVLKALEDRPGFAPSIVAGSSVGSIIGSLYAAGISPEGITRLGSEIDWLHNVIDFGDTLKSLVSGKHGGLVSNAQLGDMINRALDGRSFSDLNFDLAVVATDLENRQRVILTSPEIASRLRVGEFDGFLPAPEPFKPGFSTVVISDYNDVGSAVRASSAIPGVFLPVEIQGRRLFDGGVINQVPSDVVRAMNASLTVAVSLGYSELPERVTNVTSVLNGVLGILGLYQIRHSLDLADIGFQITGIDKRNPLKPRQTDLIHVGERDMRINLLKYMRANPGRSASVRILSLFDQSRSAV